MKKLKNTKGITLMALVITIIILIILASIGTYSGIQVVKSAQFTAFSTELKIMQTQVNSLYEKKKNNEKILLNNVETDIEDIGTAISSSSEVQPQANKAFNASGITDTSDYKYFDNTTIKNLNIEGVEGEFFVNIEKRSVVSYDGFEYEGKTYYTLNQLPDSLYNVEYNNTNNWDSSKDSFDIEYNEVEEGKYRITVSNIDYKSGNINKWQVKYKKEEEQEWKTTNNSSFTIDEVGNYRVKIANNNTESREKQIMAKSLFLPSEYQQVEYIESTGTQYIDTGVVANSTMKIDLKCRCLESSFVFGSRSSASSGYSGLTFESNNPVNVRWGNSILVNDDQYVVNQDYIVHIENGNSSINNKSSQTSYGDSFFNGNIYLFAINNNSTSSSINLSQYGKNRIYYFKIYDGNNEIRNFVPCYRKSDNKPGLYDLVNNEFYTNHGTGEFEIPANYQQVEYIESTGTQYIDTGVIANSTMKIDLKCRCLESSFVFGSRSSASSGYSGLTFESNNPVNVRWGNSILVNDDQYVVNQDYIVHIENGNSSINNKSSQTSYGDSFFNGNIYLFAINNNSTSSSINLSQYGKNRIYYFKIYDGNNEIRNFVPCYRKSDNKPGLYDLVNNVFYTNQGTGDFTKGDDVVVSDNTNVVSDNTNDGMIIIINDL